MKEINQRLSKRLGKLSIVVVTFVFLAVVALINSIPSSSAYAGDEGPDCKKGSGCGERTLQVSTPISVNDCAPASVKVTLCHATSLSINPYEEKIVDIFSVWDWLYGPQGHGMHHNDIWPQFTIPGVPWPTVIPAHGDQTILANHCKVPTPTYTATNTGTSTATSTATYTPTNTATSTNTATYTPTDTATNTPTNTATSTATDTATNTPTDTATNTPTDTATNTPTKTATNTPTKTATNTPTDTATNTPTKTATYTSTNTATYTSTSTNTPVSPGVVLPPVAAGFIPVTGGSVHAIAAGIAHTCAVTTDGGVQCWGNNSYGQLGDGTNLTSNIPVNVTGIKNISTIAAGGNHTCVLIGDEVWCWGQNSKGQLGDGTTIDSNVPVNVLSGAADVTTGYDYTCATLIAGQVMCWGNNASGQLADGTLINHLKPTLASLISNITNLDAGQNKTCGLTNSGLVKCWSNNAIQQMSSFVPVTGGQADINTFVAVNRFKTLVLALNDKGVPVVWSADQPALVGDISDALQLDGGATSSCALKSNGTVECWGNNYFGQLGNNSTISSSAPTTVTDLSGAWDLAVGKFHSCVWTEEEGILCWGLNSSGQLGNGSYENSLVPVGVK